MQAMLDAVGPTLKHGARLESRSVAVHLKEGDVAGPLAAIAKAHPDVVIGSYPHQDGQVFTTTLVLRSRDEAALDAAEAAVRAMIEDVTARV
jgi:molybdopterin-biosynthesis enzyme MoeA-like protein